MKKSLVILFLVMSLFFVSGVYAQDYYVDYENGNNNNNGLSPSSPWKHAPGDHQATGNANMRPKPGDRILLKGGVVYKGSINIDGRYVSGEINNPVIYKGDAWGQQKAILDGSEDFIGTWTKCSSALDCGGNINWQNIYYIDVDNSNFQTGFFQDGNFLWYAQEPNPYDPFYFETKPFFRIPSNDETIFHTRTSITDPRFFTQTESNYWDGAYVIVWRIPNVKVIRKITGFNPSTNTVYHEDLGGDIYTDRDTYYSVLNHLSLIDYPGEYYLDEENKRFYVWPLNNSNPSSSNFSVRERNTAIYAYYTKNLIIEGFDIKNYVMGIRVMDAGGGITPEKVIIINNNIKNLKSNDWYAIQVGGKDIIVENNSVINCQRAVGILGGGDNITIRNNYVERTSRQGIWFMGARNSLIQGNKITDIKGSHANALSVYSNSYNIDIFENIVTNSVIPFTFQSSENLNIYNNIFYSDGTSGYIFAGWSNLKGVINIYNNIVINSSNNHSIYINGCGSENTVYMTNNILQGGGCGIRRNNIYTGVRSGWIAQEGEFIETNLNKLFINPLNDLRPTSDSPAIDAGYSMPGIVDYDILGTPRPQGNGWDIGAYEYFDGQIVIPEPDPEPPIEPDPEPPQQPTGIITLQDMLNSYGQYQRGEVSIDFFLERFLKWVVYK